MLRLIFSYICHPCILFVEIYVHIFWPFLMGLFTFLLLSFKSSLYIFREGNVNLLQYSCLENPMDREALWAMVHGVAVRHD